MRILLIEDDLQLCEAIAVHMKKEAYELDVCNDGSSASYYIAGNHDVIILDRMLPGIDGLSILENIRSKGMATSVIIITAMNGLHDRIDGLDTGADDYLVKPFAVEELMARIRAVLRRPRKIEKTRLIQYGDISLDLCSFVVSMEDISVSLSRREGILLEFFLINKEQILSREQILDRVWGKDSFVGDGNIDNYIFLLRRRLKAIKTGVSINTIHGIGYKLEYSKNVK